MIFSAGGFSAFLYRCFVGLSEMNAASFLALITCLFVCLTFFIVLCLDKVCSLTRDFLHETGCWLALKMRFSSPSNLEWRFLEFVFHKRSCIVFVSKYHDVQPSLEPFQVAFCFQTLLVYFFSALNCNRFKAELWRQLHIISNHKFKCRKSFDVKKQTHVCERDTSHGIV